MTPAEPFTAHVAPQTSDRRARTSVVLAVAGTVAGLYALQSSSTRLLVSWHGFLHSAIANRFPSGTIPPENPFFAGEPLPYYWFYQLLSAGAGALLQVDLIRAFQVVILASLAGVVLAGAALGLKCFRSIGVGLLAAYLALAGADPLGPLIAGAKFFVRGQALWHGEPPEVVTAAVFVTDDLADEWLTQPLLPALYFAADWRYGQNLVWFLDISSRAPAIALLLWALFLLLRPRTVSNMVLLATTYALFAAINPVMALPTAAVFIAASAAIAFESRVGGGGPTADVGSLLRTALPLMAGALLAAPTYVDLFTKGQGGWALTSLSNGALKWPALTLTFSPIAALAVYGAFRVTGASRSGIRAMTLAGLALLGAAFVFDIETLRHLEGGNEHNLTNAALCLLAIPAAAWITPSGAAQPRRLGHPGVLVFIGFLPTTLLTIAAYLGSPPIPIAFEARTLVRLPRDGPLNALYSWIRESTPADAVFIADPAMPVKMSGNVAELPAFTARTLFVDQPGYMTDAHRDAELRRVLSRAASAGEDLTSGQRAYLHALKRPMYLVTYRVDSANVLQALEQRHGAPLFHHGFVAVFPIETSASPGSR